MGVTTQTITIWAGAVLAIATLAGCRPAFPNCRTEKGDADCADRFLLCIDGKCGECRSDMDCNEMDGRVCVMNACMRPDMRPERILPPGTQ